VFNATGFKGTSGSAPQIAGVVALVLGANPNLYVRDVRQILLLSARHFDLADPDLQTNGAGLRVSHNLGFWRAGCRRGSAPWPAAGPIVRP